jgi:threonine/homoserine/homoserine lactone efflux protein
MVPLSHLAAFAVTAVVIIAVPGPSVLFVIGRSLSLGRRGGLMSVLGNTLGMLPQIAAVALGVGTVIAQSVVLFQVLKLAGAGYLVYLGVKAIRHRRESTAAEPAADQPAGRLIRQGFMVGLTNPKSIVFFVAVLPQFTDQAAGAIPLQLATLGLMMATFGLLHDSVWALVAGSARQWFARSKQRMSRLGATGGVMMIGLGATLALSGARD